jgi:diadenosine tetraphosphate (Ap4A) HIT family hydrolase
LCDASGGEVLWHDDFCRVVYVEEADYPGYCRVILQRHVREMTDLSPADRMRVMHNVFATETALREMLRPDKINLASLGNAVPHLHWHVIPRYRDDRHFPLAIWAPPKRSSAPRPACDRRVLAELLRRHLGEKP